MTSTIVGAFLSIVVTLLLGFIAGWRYDVDAKQASMLNRMVMLYALPLCSPQWAARRGTRCSLKIRRDSADFR